MIITSLSNPKIVRTAKLLDKKYRKVYGMYLLEGSRLIFDAIEHNAEITDIFVKESSSSEYSFDNATIVSDSVFTKISDTVNSQGVVAVVKLPKRELNKPIKNALILDGLQDPGNVGTLIRTAVACGFTDIYAVGCVDMYSPKVLRSAMSAHFCINIYETAVLNDVLEKCKDSLTVAADMNGKNVFEYGFHGKTALIVGNEGNGLSPLSKQSADAVVSLPMENGFESLNAAVAGSVIMYQIYSQSKHNN